MPDYPSIEGVTFRGFAGSTDYPHMAAIINAAKVANGWERSDTAEDVAAYYSHLSRSDVATDMCFAEVDGAAVGYSRVWWAQEVDGPWTYGHICFLDPAFAGRGIGSAMFAWNEARLREIAAGHPDGEKVFQGFAADVNRPAHDLFVRNGYRPVTYDAEMVRPSVTDLPDCRLPEGLEIRPVTEDQLRTIWEADVEAFRDHWGFAEPTEEDYEQFLAFPHWDESLWKIAWDGDRVAGQVRSFIDESENREYGRRRGYTEFISTARPWRRKGVARALIVESIRELAARGMDEAGLGVHTENPNGAYDLYRSLGYEVVTTSTTYRKPME